jgi:hypothetical protein
MLEFMKAHFTSEPEPLIFFLLLTCAAGFLSIAFLKTWESIKHIHHKAKHKLKAKKETPPNLLS